MIHLISSLTVRSFSHRAKLLVSLTQKTNKMANQPMNKESAQEIMANVDNFLFDCDGVIWGGDGPIAGSVETLKKLKQMGKRVFYVTNNSSASRADYLQRCRKYGLPAEEENIICTAYIAAQYLKMIDFKGKVYLMGKEESLGKELGLEGMKYIGPGPDHVQSLKYEDWLQTQLDPEVNCVLVGFDPYISYPKILKASSYLKKPDCLFLVTNEDWCLPHDGPIRIPGTGCITSPVKVACQREPTVLGKPATVMFDVISKAHNLDVSRTMMVGDRYETDIAFGETCGMKYTLLVFSGVNTQEDVDNGRARASFCAPCLGDFGKFL